MDKISSHCLPLGGLAKPYKRYKPASEDFKELLRKGDSEAIRELFVLYGEACISFLLQYSNDCDRPLAEDLMMDAMLNLISAAREGRLAEIRDVRNYLFATCKNLFLKHRKKAKNSFIHQDNVERYYYEFLHQYPKALIEMDEDIRWPRVQKAIELLGEKCRKILQMFYFEKVSMKRIASRLGFSGEKVAKTSKSRCMSQLKKLIQAGDSPLSHPPA